MSYHLVKEEISKDTVEALEQLLESAKAGQVIGIAFALMLRRRKFLVDCAGEACTNPVLARGAVGALDDQLGLMIQGRLDSQTTI